MSKLTLEQRIAEALKNEIAVADLAATIAEVDAAILTAVDAAERERIRSYDPTIVDPNKARQSRADAEFVRDRLQAALAALQERLQQVQAAEYAAQWEADYGQVAARRDELATELREVYAAVVAKLVDLFRRVETVDVEVSRINGSAPPDEQRRLCGVELTWRGMQNFSRESPSIIKTTVLPNSERSETTAWPPPHPSVAAQYAMSTAPQHDPRFSADWAAARSGSADAQKGQPNAIQREQRRIADYYKEERRLQDERRHREDVADRAAKRSA
jgi:hypothetical protein